jgi:signal transduction histidine kinase
VKNFLRPFTRAITCAANETARNGSNEVWWALRRVLQPLRRVVPMLTTAFVPEEQHFILSSLSPDRAQRRLALAIVLALLVAFLVTAGPLSTVQLSRIEAVVPAYAAPMFVVDLITAVLLFAQFFILRSFALLAIAIGYLFTALVAIPWMLAFPGVFAPSGLLGAGLQSTAWLYILWHAGFPVSVIAYALLKDADPAKRPRERAVGPIILASVAASVTVVCAATFVIVAGDKLLPRLMIDAVHIGPLWDYAAAFPLLLSILALVTLWARWRSVLDLWLMVVMCAYLVEICLTSYFSTRFSIGWYVGRACGLLSGSLVLLVLLYEITILYAQLLHAVSAHRREREARLMTGDAVSASIAHEIKQPLSGIVANADAGLRWLERSMPNQVKTTLEQIVADGHRAGAIIDGVRAIFKKDARNSTSIAINDLIGEALALMRDELHKHGVSVQAELNERLPQVTGDRVQMQQVLLNLITNAIDSMVANDGSRVLCVKSTIHDPSGVLVSVADSGTGVRQKDTDRIFNPLFTTKSHGMGMGLPISRAIIESHNGRLWVSPNTPEGAVFHFVLLADSTMSASAPPG